MSKSLPPRFLEETLLLSVPTAKQAEDAPSIVWEAKGLFKAVRPWESQSPL